MAYRPLYCAFFLLSLLVASATGSPSRPVFLQHPAGVTVPLGSSTTLKVVVRADPPAGLQWYRNSSPVSGATGSELTITGLTVLTAGQYTVIATNALGSALSATGEIIADVQPDPRATGLTRETTVFQAERVVLDAMTTGTEPITHTWLINGATIASATSSKLTIPFARSQDAGRYFYTAFGPLQFNNAFTDLAVLPLEAGFSRRGLGNLIQVASLSSGACVALSDGIFWVLEPGVQGTDGVYYSEVGKFVKIATDGSRIFRVARNDKTIKVLSADNPSLPEIIASYQPSDSAVPQLSSLVSRWPLVYFALGENGLHIVDFSDLANPKLIGSYSEAGHPVNDVDLVGNTAALCTQSGGLVLLDVSAPGSIKLLGRSAAFKFAQQAVLRGSDALVDSGASQVFVYDISNPSLPLLKSTVPLAQTAGDLLLLGDQLFVAEPQALEVFQVSTPADLKRVYEYDVQAGAISIAGQNLIVASGLGGMVGIDLRTAPSVVRTFPATQRVGVGGEIRVLANAVGAPPLRYQWFKGNAPVPNATNSVLQLSMTGAATAGSYRVEVSNDGGLAPGSTVTVELDGAVSAPDVTLITSGTLPLKLSQTATLTASVTGSPAPTLQWLSNSVPVPGANALSLTVGPFPANSKATFQLKASNAAGDATSAGVLVMTVPDVMPRLSLSIVGGKAEVRSVDGLGFKWQLRNSPSLSPGTAWKVSATRILSTQNQLLLSATTNEATYYQLFLP